MNQYEYKVITVYPGAMLNEYEFNDLGGQGFRVVSHVRIMGTYSEGEGVPPAPQYEQFLMEKVTYIKKETNND